MNRVLFILLIPFIQTGGLMAQDIPFSRYEIQGDDVYVKFHESCINSTEENCAALLDFKDFNLDDVIKSGLISLWEKDGWTLHKIGIHSFELHKKLNYFDKDFWPEDKFKIDGNYWNFPVSERVKQGSGEVLPEPTKIDYNGNVEFTLKGRKKAKKVILSGSFNDWNEQAIALRQIGDEWKIKLKMAPGIYEYKFIVDGEWITDPQNSFMVENQHYTFNSILTVGKKVQFNLVGYKNAKSVSMSGSFNNWDKTGSKLKKTKDGWTVSIMLPPGKHYYKFIIDGNQWMTDPLNELQERDTDGNVNSVLLIH